MSLVGWAWLVVCSVAVVAANILLRYGIDRAQVTLFSDGIAGLPRQIVLLLLEPAFFGALIFYGVAMLCWFRLVATEHLSVAYPLLAALTFLLITTFAALLFGEPFGPRKTAGLVAILLGLYLVSTA